MPKELSTKDKVHILNPLNPKNPLNFLNDIYSALQGHLFRHNAVGLARPCRCERSPYDEDLPGGAADAAARANARNEFGGPHQMG